MELCGADPEYHGGNMKSRTGGVLLAIASSLLALDNNPSAFLI